MTHQLITHNQFDDSLTQYGDGVFETMLAAKNDIYHWQYHWQRLQSSCQRLTISLPEQITLLQQITAELAKHAHRYSVVKIIVSRGKGLRGYRSHNEQPCFVQISVSSHQFELKKYQGLNLRICETRLSHQPLLAGMKHINRLEYVMARRESADIQFDEGLLLNYDNEVIEGLISNVFMIKNQQILTPNLSGSGVSGTMRAYLFDWLPTQGYTLEESSLSLDDIAAADEVFLTNATSGILPVAAISGINKTYAMAMTQQLRQQMEHPSCVI